MAAGLGYKEFTTGDVLTAADANGYLASQVVMVFASAAARTSAIASPQEGMFSFLKDTNSTEYYTGSAWAAVGGGGGKVLQVVSATNTATQSTSSTSFVDAISVSITPSSATSKVLVMGYISGSSDAAATQIAFRLARGSTGIFVGDASGSRTQSTGILFQPSNANYSSQSHASFLDSPATTSATTYRVQYKVDDTASSTIYLGRTYNDNNAGYTVRTPSAGIIVMEIGA